MEEEWSRPVAATGWSSDNKKNGSYTLIKQMYKMVVFLQMNYITSHV